VSNFRRGTERREIVRKKLLVGILVSIVTTSAAYAFNLSFLEYSPVYYFTKSDWAIAESTALKALNSARDNQKVIWRNPQTNAHGYVIPTNTTTQNGRKCRQLKIFSEAHQVTGQSVYRFCRIDGDWKITD